MISPGAEVAASARLRDTIVWAGAVIGADVVLTRCVVSDGVRVPAGFAAEGRVIVPAHGLTARADDAVVGDLLLVSPVMALESWPRGLEPCTLAS